MDPRMHEKLTEGPVIVQKLTVGPGTESPVVVCTFSEGLTDAQKLDKS